MIFVSDRHTERVPGSDATPDHVAVVLGADADPGTVKDFYLWCYEFGVGTATACLPGADERTRRSLEDALTDLDPPVRKAREAEDAENHDRILSYAGGRDEVVGALRRIAEEVESGGLEAAEIDPEAVEDRLEVPGEPDLLIEATGEGLSDALLWQTAYSELCYVEGLDRSSFVRCLDEYKERERRFGR